MERDVRELYDAAQGRHGVDEIEFCGIIFNRSDAEIRQIADAYRQHHRHHLDAVIHTEFSGHVQHALLYAVEGALNPMGRDARLIEHALLDADYQAEKLAYRLIRAYWKGGERYLQSIKHAYQERYHRNLIRHIENHMSGHFMQLLVALLEG